MVWALLCIFSVRHYSILHKNLVQMGLALDNYPTSPNDPHEAVKLFPDEIVRKDVLDELQPAGKNPNLPKAPLPSACQQCYAMKVMRNTKQNINLDIIILILFLNFRYLPRNVDLS